ncbi:MULTISPECIES: DNA-directed RNA polymerase [unclassified Tatumella]|uniref:DNA-directed RNA polymerase n=1 Tax=unclassified Tatumella TaxID=2649542 RepID=UPI001BB056C2|nr:MULTISPECIES: DNA-directed RNA polymerase [unclassified Tatumella]MBS0876523.1 hypothetical protein [Tatumella sp. JGM82]MBS0889696.1 hypothetical protein [Tatumella sp. JGM94]MBS0900818.1 hypothetical protein [Tatumella sp. JGM100]
MDDEINKLIQLYGLDLVKQQIDFEQQSLEDSIYKKQQTIIHSIDKGTSAIQPPVSYFVNNITETTIKLTDKFIAEQSGNKNKKRIYNILVDLKEKNLLEKAIFISVSSSFNTILSLNPKQHEITIQKLALNIAENIQNEERAQYIKEKSPDRFKYLLTGVKERISVLNKKQVLKRSEEFVPGFEYRSKELSALLGSYFIDCLITYKILESKVIFKSPTKSLTVINFTQSTMRMINNNINKFINTLVPKHFPTFIPPKSWTDLTGGGYYTECFNEQLFRMPKNKMYEHFENQDCSKLMIVANKLQSVPYKINEKVLELLKEINKMDYPILGIPQKVLRDKPLFESHWTNENNTEEIKEWKIKTRKWYATQKSNQSIYLQFINTVSIAEKFKNYEKIYFPCNYDYRGRLYYIPAILNPQSHSTAKALLTFSEGSPIGAEGFECLKIHGANVYGKSKISNTDRIKFINDNHNEIIQAATTPLESLFLEQSEEPILFYAFCCEYKNVIDYGLSYKTTLPVSLDGSNSGQQHLAMLSRDEETAKEVNLLPSTEDEKPNDLYQMVADKVIIKLQKIVELNTDNKIVIETTDSGETYEKVLKSDSTLAQEWLDFGITRKVTKLPVMTSVYSVTINGIKNQLLDDVLKNTEYDKSSAHASFLSKIIFDECRSLKAMSVLSWFQTIERSQLANSDTLRWTTPDKIEWRQHYYKSNKKTVRTLIQGNLKRFLLNIDNDEINPRRSINGISPNIIHSLDSYHLRTVAEKFDFPLMVIHDSFSTTAGNIPELKRTILTELVNMYEDSTILDSIEKHSDTKLELGNLNIQDVLKSIYSFN